MAKETMAQKAARLSKAATAAKTLPAPVSADTTPRQRPQARPATTVKTVRMTLDLAEPLHNSFEDWTTNVARLRGNKGITRSKVLRELVRQLMDDDDLALRVIDAVEADVSK